MLPTEPAERARVRMLEELCDTYYEAINWALAEIRFFRRATRRRSPSELTARAGEQIAGVHAWLERAARQAHVVQRRRASAGAI